MFCTKCGTQLFEGQKFCGICGAPIKGLAPEQVAGQSAQSAPYPMPEQTTAVSYTLPDSALEPQTPVPQFYSEDITAVVPVAQPAQQYRAIPRAEQPSFANRKRTLAIAGSSVAALVIICIVVMFGLGLFDPPTVIDSKNFPNEVIRIAVLDKLDADGDGRLSSSESRSVTAIVMKGSDIEFFTGDDAVILPNPNVQFSGGSTQSESTDDASYTKGIGNDPGSGSKGVSNIGLPSAPSVKSLVLDDCDLTDLDLSQFPDLEYVSLLGNPDLKSLDLSKNKKIKNLFCDPDVTLTGLEESGYYFTDLITSIVASGSNKTDSFSIEYDTSGRPLTAFGKKYEYDDQGRVVSVVDAGQSERLYEKYTYAENGLLATSSIFEQSARLPETLDVAYGYDVNGQPIQLVRTGDDADAGIFAYDKRNPTTFKDSAGGGATFAYDDAGRLTNEFSSSAVIQVSENLSYNDAGALATYSANGVGFGCSIYKTEVATAYDASGAPKKTSIDYYNQGNQSYEVSYTCNADGYVTEVAWGKDVVSPLYSNAKVTYIKRVGLLADRTSERFVPQWRLTFDTASMTTCAFSSERLFGFAVGQDWCSSLASYMPVSFKEWGPIQRVGEQLGFLPQMITNSNELSLAAYDCEHWKNGLNMKEAQPVSTDVTIQNQLTQAAAVQLPLQSSVYLNDAVYGPVVQQYLAAAREAGSGLTKALSGEYPDIPVAGQMMIEQGQAFVSRWDCGLYFALVDLDSDGVNELAVTFPPKNLGDVPKIEGKEVIALYGQVDGKPKFITGSALRAGAWVTSNGDIVQTSISFSHADSMASLSQWNGKEAQCISSVSYSYDDKNKTNPFEITTTDSNGVKQTTRGSHEQALATIDAFLEANPRAVLPWTFISCSKQAS